MFGRKFGRKWKKYRTFNRKCRVTKNNVKITKEDITSQVYPGLDLSNNTNKTFKVWKLSTNEKLSVTFVLKGKIKNQSNERIEI